MATKKKEDTKKKGGKEKDAEKEAKRKARMEALKNRPAEQRPNSICSRQPYRKIQKRTWYHL